MTDKLAIVAFEDKAFRARLKLACNKLSCFSPSGMEIPLAQFIQVVKNFNDDDLDDDLSSLGKSTVPINTPDKRQRSN